MPSEKQVRGRGFERDWDPFLPFVASEEIHTLPHHPAAALFPMLADDELAALADDIAKNGLLEPVWLYSVGIEDDEEDYEEEFVLLDGRNRVAACAMAGVSVQSRVYDGDDPVSFVISLNVARRHLTTGQKAAIALDALPLFEAEAARRKRELSGTHRNEVEADLPQPLPREPQARDKAAKVVGTSGRAVGQMKRIAEQAPDLADKVRDGSTSLDRADRILRDREAERRHVENARKLVEAQASKPRVDIRHGDFRDVLGDIAPVNAIITDPPYPAEYLSLLEDLAVWADKVLTPDGVLAVLIGQTHLPTVYRLLDGYRPYRWTAAYLTEGPGYVSHPRRVQSNWKPLLVYGGGSRFSDVIRSTGTDAGAKDLHHWGQDYGAFHTIVERLTEPGDTVVDPFMGSGTTLMAAAALGRHAIGCDVDEASVATARERLQ